MPSIEGAVRRAETLHKMPILTEDMYLRREAKDRGRVKD